MLSIWGLHPNRDDKCGTHTFGSAENLAEVFTNYEQIVDKIPQDKQYNIFFSLYHLEKGSFKRAEAIVFDIDGIGPEKELYIPAIEKALGLEPGKSPVIFTGNGIHFYVKLKFPIERPDFFKDRAPYEYWCDKINEHLEAGALPGEADKDFFKHTNGGRLPLTVNRKPMKNWWKIDEKEPDKHVIFHNKVFEYAGFDWNKAKPAKAKQIKEKDQPWTKAVDTNYVIDNCKFLQHARDNQNDLKNDEWTKAIGLTCYMDEDNSKSHEFSKEYKDYDHDEVEELSERMRNYSPSSCQTLKECGRCKGCPHRVHNPLELKNTNFIATEETGFSTITPKGKIIRHPLDLQRYLDREYNYIYVGEIDRIYVFNGKHYERTEKAWVRTFAQESYSPPIEKGSDADEFLKLAMRFNYKDTRFFEQTNRRGLINLDNGVLDTQRGTLSSHSPKYGFTSVLPYEYVEGAKCPTWDLLLRNVTCGRQHLVDLLEEFLGYCVAGGEYKYNNILILSGAGSNGKTTLLNCFKMVLGEKNVSSISVADLKGFNASLLEDKLANIMEEEAPSCFKDTGPLKKVTGNSPITVQRKYENGYSMTNRAKVIMSYNKVPYLGDTTEGMKRRLLVVPFDLNLQEKPEYKIDDLEEKIAGELPGILLKALAGYNRLMERKGFEIPPESKSITEEMVHDSDAVQEWFDTFVEVTGNGDTLTFKDAYDNFKHEMEQGKESRLLSYRAFTKRVRDIARTKKLPVPTRCRKIDGAKLVPSVIEAGERF
jgi:putative DNA primase/helicase